jgi:hypothetical protein
MTEVTQSTRQNGWQEYKPEGNRLMGDNPKRRVKAGSFKGYTVVDVGADDGYRAFIIDPRSGDLKREVSANSQADLRAAISEAMADLEPVA